MMITRAVIVHTTTVSMNGSYSATNPSVTGRLVSRIFEGEVESEEAMMVQYNEVLPIGVYFYMLRTDNLVKTGKFIRTIE